MEEEKESFNSATAVSRGVTSGYGRDHNLVEVGFNSATAVSRGVTMT